VQYLLYDAEGHIIDQGFEVWVQFQHRQSFGWSKYLPEAAPEVARVRRSRRIWPCGLGSAQRRHPSLRPG
jgi:hypothetical protein